MTNDERILVSIGKIEESIKHINVTLMHLQDNSQQHFCEVKDLKDFTNLELEKRDKEINELCKKVASLETMQKVLWFVVGGAMSTGIGSLIVAIFKVVTSK